MKELSTKARALLESARLGEPSLAAEKTKVLEAVQAKILAGAVPSTAALSGVTAAARATTSKVALMLFWVLGAATVAVALTVQSPVIAPEPVIEAVEAPPVVEPVEVVIPPAPTPTPTPAPAPVGRPTPRKNKPVVVVAPAPAAPVAPKVDLCALTVELRALKQAQQQLIRAPDKSLAGLEDFARGCSTGPLLEERQATRALALCGLGRKDEGHAELKSLEARFPQSPSVARVRQTCR